MNYIGIDQSLTCTGIVVLNDVGEFQFSSSIKSKKTGIERLSEIYFFIFNLTKQFTNSIFATEGYSYLSGQKKDGKSYGKQPQAGEVKATIELAIYNAGLLCVSYQPRQHRAKTIKYQKNGKDKKPVVDLVNRMYGMNFDYKEHDIADAYTIARALYQDVERMGSIYGTELYTHFIQNTPFKHLTSNRLKEFEERYLID